MGTFENWGGACPPPSPGSAATGLVGKKKRITLN